MSDNANPYRDFVAARIAAGDDPNVITESIEDAIGDLPDWVRWGDGRWRVNTVCAKCGSVYPGICGKECRPCTDEKPILYSEWLRRRGGA